MALFRFHRGGLHESLQTTVIVKNMHELREAARPFVDHFFLEPTDDFVLNVNAYPSKDNNFDGRIGWYTHIVALTITADKSNRIMKSIDSAPIGFLSEPLDE